MEALKIGILGTGVIAATLADTMNRMPGVELYGAASRSLEKAKDFGERFGVKRTYGSYEELVADPEIELVYIATPHSEHYKNAILCLEHGKHVLCEKAFAVNAAQAKEMIALAEEKKLLITEAMWVRYMPMAKTLRDVLDSGVIGEPMTLTASLCYLIDKIQRLVDPNLAGGALLDVGVYTIAFASLVFGDEITSINSAVIKTESGVDSQNSMTFCYPGGKIAVLNSSIHVLSDRRGIIYGTKGYIEVENINNFESIKVFDEKRRLKETYTRPEQISGYEYQIEASRKAIREQRLECPEMPHHVTIRMMETMDALREQWGIRYPFE